MVFGLVKSTPWHLNNPCCSMNGSCFNVVPDPWGVRCCMGLKVKTHKSRCLLKNLYPLWRGTVSTTPLVIHSKKLELIFLVMQVRRWVLDVLDPSLAYPLLQQCYIQLFTVYFQWISTDHDSNDGDWQPRILQRFGCVFLHSIWVCLKTKWTPPQNL